MNTFHTFRKHLARSHLRFRRPRHTLIGDMRNIKNMHIVTWYGLGKPRWQTLTLSSKTCTLQCGMVWGRGGLGLTLVFVLCKVDISIDHRQIDKKICCAELLGKYGPWNYY